MYLVLVFLMLKHKRIKFLFFNTKFNLIQGLDNISSDVFFEKGDVRFPMVLRKPSSELNLTDIVVLAFKVFSPLFLCSQIPGVEKSVLTNHNWNIKEFQEKSEICFNLDQTKLSRISCLWSVHITLEMESLVLPLYG